MFTQDRNLAENIGIKFQTPEEFFLGEAPRPFTRTFEPSDYLPVSAAEGLYPYKGNTSPIDEILIFV